MGYHIDYEMEGGEWTMSDEQWARARRAFEAMLLAARRMEWMQLGKVDKVKIDDDGIEVVCDRGKAIWAHKTTGAGYLSPGGSRLFDWLGVAMLAIVRDLAHEDGRKFLIKTGGMDCGDQDTCQHPHVLELLAAARPAGDIVAGPIQRDDSRNGDEYYTKCITETKAEREWMSMRKQQDGGEQDNFFEDDYEDIDPDTGEPRRYPMTDTELAEVKIPAVEEASSFRQRDPDQLTAFMRWDPGSCVRERTAIETYVNMSRLRAATVRAARDAARERLRQKAVAAKEEDGGVEPAAPATEAGGAPAAEAGGAAAAAGGAAAAAGGAAAAAGAGSGEAEADAGGPDEDEWLPRRLWHG